MTGLRENASEASRQRESVARRLAECCPPELGAEIALTGSVARGIADERSDIEIRFWVDAIPSAQARRDWVESVGGANISLNEDTPEADGSVWLTCRVDGFWIEMGWGEAGDTERLLRRIVNGEIVRHDPLTVAWMVSEAIPLRSSGMLARWRSELRYPESLQRAIVRDQTAVWGDPHVPGVRLALAERGELFALSMRLSWDIQNLLRVLWAVNRVWDRDWKWTDDITRDLPLRPERLPERLNRVFMLEKPRESIAVCFRLIEETLELVPSEIDVSAPLRNIRAGLVAAGALWNRACAAVIRDGSILMVRCNHGTHAHWTLPGGGIDQDESAEEAAIRELQEEALVHGEHPVFLYRRPWGREGTGTETCFLVQVSPDQEPALGHDPELEKKGQQLTDIAWRPLEEISDDVQVARVLEALQAQNGLP